MNHAIMCMHLYLVMVMVMVLALSLTRWTSLVEELTEALYCLK